MNLVWEVVCQKIGSPAWCSAMETVAFHVSVALVVFSVACIFILALARPTSRRVRTSSDKRSR